MICCDGGSGTEAERMAGEFDSVGIDARVTVQRAIAAEEQAAPRGRGEAAVADAAALVVAATGDDHLGPGGHVHRAGAGERAIGPREAPRYRHGAAAAEGPGVG